MVDVGGDLIGGAHEDTRDHQHQQDRDPHTQNREHQPGTFGDEILDGDDHLATSP
ncbi:hypothetical protein I546_1531 [Mycobacterium kansasii 732]|nr:hypothetical protein I546_1531 [Mycobacterium kansasii 732]